MIHFIVDSTFCVDEEYKQKNDIKVAGLTILLDDKIYYEDKMDEWHNFFEDVSKSKNFPKTTQPSPQAFINIIEQIMQQDDNAQIIILTLSQSLSGTYSCAKMVAEQYKGKVTVIDSTQTGESSLLLLEELVDAKNAGKDLEYIIDLAERTKGKISIQFIPMNLEFLRKGGRIGLISSKIADMLNIKPILYFKKGVLIVYKKCLGMGKAISEMIDNTGKSIKKIYVCYVNESPFTNMVLEKMQNKFSNLKIFSKGISPVVGSHVGLGAIGLAVLEN